MNKRIKQLVKQANLTEVIDDAYQERNDWQPFVEKFAQLIVRECINEMRAGHNSKLRFGDVIHNMKIHFGVEE